MSPDDIAALFDGLAGGRLQDFVREGTTLRFKVVHPGLAAKIQPDFTHFLGALMGCTRFELQPFRNESTLLTDLPSIQRMRLTLHSAQAAAPHVHVYGVGRGGERDARLLVQATELILMDEAFDYCRVDTLRALRDAPQPED